MSVIMQEEERGKTHLTSVNLELYRKQFVQVAIPVAMAIIASIILVYKNPYNFSYFVIRQLSTPIMAVVVLFSVAHSMHQKKQFRKLDGMEDFDKKVKAHEKFYRARLLWYLFSSWVSCALYVLAMHRLFLVFALVDGLILLSHYPNKNILKRELKNDDIIFY